MLMFMFILYASLLYDVLSSAESNCLDDDSIYCDFSQILFHSRPTSVTSIVKECKSPHEESSQQHR